MARVLVLLGFLLLGLAFAQQQGVDLSVTFARLTGLVAPAPPLGRLSEVPRPDLSGGNPDPAPEFALSGNFPGRDLPFGGQLRHWSFLVPTATTEPEAVLPAVVVLLHGSNRDGVSMLQMWQDQVGPDVMLIAPDAADPAAWNTQSDGPDFLAAVLKTAYDVYPYDHKRIYLYGHSAGARYALYLAACTIGPWRAVAVHAGSLPTCAALPQNAAIPALIQIGDSDALFDLATVRTSAADLAAGGHDVTLEVIPAHGHWFYDVGPKLAADAMAFFRAQP